MALPLINASTTRAGIRKEVMSLAWPVLATLAADPLAGIVALYFIGLLGEEKGKVQLAACGTATSIFNTTLKVFQVPLISVATSALAAVKGRSEGDPVAIGNAASSAIITSLGMSVIQAFLVGFGAPAAAVIWQVGRGSDMYPYLIRYLWVRGLGSPITLMMLTLQGVFRGLKDVKEPLYATFINNAVNIVLCPIMLFWFKFESPGAAASILLGEAAACVFLLVRLTRKYPIRLGGAATFKELASLLPACVWLMLRTSSLTSIYAVATAVSNTTNVAFAAAHQVMFSLWMATTLLSDSMAVAAQTLISVGLGKFDHHTCHLVVQESVRLAGCLGTIMMCLTFLGRYFIAHFTSSPDVIAVMTNFVWFIVLTQPITAQAYVWDGILYGVSGFKYASVAITTACVLPMLFMAIAYCSDKLVQTSHALDILLTFGHYLTSRESVVLTWVWLGLTVLMVMRLVVIASPYVLQMYPFAVLYQDSLAGYAPLSGMDKDAEDLELELPESPCKAVARKVVVVGEGVNDWDEQGSAFDGSAGSYEAPVLSHGVEVGDGEGSSSEGSSHGGRMGDHASSSSSSLVQDYGAELEPSTPDAATIKVEHNTVA